MFDITIRRSAATLGVVAGLLAAAAPASAVPGTQVGSEGVKAPVSGWTEGNSQPADLGPHTQVSLGRENSIE